MSKPAPCVRLLTAAVILAPLAAWSQPAYLVSDLHRRPSNLNGVAPVKIENTFFQGRLFYTGFDPRFGEEPWTSDGTAEGTGMFLDLCPGPCSSSPRDFTAVGEHLYFSADDDAFGREPWMSNGTPEGTRMLRETVPGPSAFMGYTPYYAAVGERLFFATLNGDRFELWTSDGTRRGTRRLAVLPGVELPGQVSPVDAEPILLSGTDERLYFLMGDRYSRQELWTSDGTAEGTQRLILNCNECELMGHLADRLFLRRRDTRHGAEVWVSDGSPSTTRLLADSCPGSCNGDPLDFLTINGTGFFTALDGKRANASRTLFRTDGTAEGTQPALDSRRDSLIGVFNAVAWRDQVWFTSWDRLFRQGRIAMFDPADDALAVLRNGFAALGRLTTAGDHLFFVDAGARGEELWVSDGSAAGTKRMTGPFEMDYLDTGLRVLDPGTDRLFFSGFSHETGWELWTSDATPDGSTMIVEAGVDPGSSSPRGAVRLGERLLFVADLEDEEMGAFTTDGSSAGTVPHDIGAAPPGEVGRLGNKVIYSESTEDVLFQSGLWVSRGTNASTRRIHNRLFNATGFVQAGDRLFFAAELPGKEIGKELWASDGTRGGTRLVLDINPGIQPTHQIPCCANNSSPHELTALGSEVLFAAANEDFGNNVELWKSDGTPEGTVMVADLHPGPPTPYGIGELSGSHPSDLTFWNGRVYFTADDGEAGRQLWASDGTSAGTGRVADIGRGAPGSEPHGLFVLREKLYFFARRGRMEALWSSDGTAGGTVRVHDLVHRQGSSRVLSPLVVGERVFFVAVSEDLGPELWVSDGTAVGTSLVTDLRPGRRGSYPGGLTPLGNGVVFAADDGVSGRELWVSDGTEAGTTLLADVIPGPDSSSPAELFVDGSLLYFSAATPDEGRELWAVEHALEP